MKKSLFFVAAATLVLASCNNDVKIDENVALEGSNAQKEISFSTYAQGPKRVKGNAPVANGAAFPTDYNFFISAYAAGAAGDYFNKAEYAHLTSTIWAGKDAANKQYWPLAAETLNFLAVTKQTTTGANAVFGDNGENFASQVVVTLANNATEQHDLMYAHGQGSVEKSGNALIFPEKVDMEFNHALAWVCFRVKAGNSVSKAIAIKGIKLKGAKYAGTFQAVVDGFDGTSALDWDADNTKWTAASASSDKYSPNLDGDTLSTYKKITTASFTAIGDGLLVVPTYGFETPQNSIASFDIEYSLNGNDYTYNYVPAELTYEKGKKYIYDITMTLHEIFVSATVANWADGGTTNVPIPTNSFVAPTGGTYDVAAAAGTYTIYVSGLGVADVITAAAANTSMVTAVTATNTAGVAKIAFTVAANASDAQSTTITLTDTTDPAKNTTITINQAAGN